MSIAERASRARAIIGTLASEGRGPKMSVPVRDEDEDVFVCDTLYGLESEVERLTRERDYLYRQAVFEVMRGPGGFNEDQASLIVDRTLAALPATPEQENERAD